VGKEALKALGREALRTGCNIIRDIAENPPTQTTDIISRHVAASTQNIIDKLRGSGARKRKRAAATTARKVKRRRKTRRNLTISKTIKRDIFFIIYISHGTTMDLAFVSSKFDIFARKPVQNSIQDTNVVVYKPVAPIDQSDLEFLIPADLSTYVDPDTKLYIRGKFTKPIGTELDATDHTADVNNFLRSLFSQCTIALNDVNITQAGDL
jgi:hypothetical protein